MSEHNYDNNRFAGRPSDSEQQEPSSGYQPPWSSASEGQNRYVGPYGGDYGRDDRRFDDPGRQENPYSGRNRQQSPYQYSTSNGWQQGARRERYEWDFDEYDNSARGGKRKRKSRGLVVFAVSLLCVLSVGLLALTGYNIVKTFSLEEGVQSSTLYPAEESAPPPATSEGGISVNINNKPLIAEPSPSPGERMTIPQVAKAVGPAVVGVVNYRVGQILEPYTEGSGIILTSDGYIVTNEHVVANAEAIVVVFDDDTECEATVVGTDARTDLAVLKVNRTDLVPAVFGNSDELEVGETVIAIGNPGGTELAGSVTRGIVSAVNRIVKNPHYSTNYIQTDAAVNPGNSGGALCNEFGQVVGINSAKIVAEGYEGISFAIPINEAAPIIEQLIANGRVTGRVLLGITGEPIGEIIARTHNVPAGIQIRSITSAALSESGVLPGDIITHINDTRTLDLNDIRTIIDTHKPGDTVKLTLYRQARVSAGTTFDVQVALIEDA